MLPTGQGALRPAAKSLNLEIILLINATRRCPAHLANGKRTLSLRSSPALSSNGATHECVPVTSRARAASVDQNGRGGHGVGDGAGLENPNGPSEPAIWPCNVVSTLPGAANIPTVAYFGISEVVNVLDERGCVNAIISRCRRWRTRQKSPIGLDRTR
jgi:hypothetical protein